MEVEEFLNINVAEAKKTDEEPVVKKTTIKLFDVNTGELKVEEEKEVV